MLNFGTLAYIQTDLNKQKKPRTFRIFLEILKRISKLFKIKYAVLCSNQQTSSLASTQTTLDKCFKIFARKCQNFPILKKDPNRASQKVSFTKI
jgi:hypothetical protein